MLNCEVKKKCNWRLEIGFSGHGGNQKSAPVCYNVDNHR